MQPAPSSQHRKSSLATLQKTLDSILEESEHDSSTHKKSSISSSLTSSFEDEEDFDSDCSVNSAQDETHELLLEFEASTQTFIATEQERILKGILEMPPAASTAVAASAATALQVEKKNELLEGVNETLATLQAEISSLDKFISIKDRFIDQAAASSAELAKAKHDLQNQFSRHADEIALIKQKLELARTSLRFADNDHDESKVQPLKCQLENSKLKINDMEAKITGFLNMVTLEQDFNQLSLEDNIRQRIDELRTYKDALVKEKQIVDHLLDHLFKPDPRICQLCREHPSQIRHNLAQPGTDPMKIQQRKYELDVLMETLDTAIDMKNSALLGQHWQVIVFTFLQLAKEFCCFNTQTLPNFFVCFRQVLANIEFFFGTMRGGMVMTSKGHTFTRGSWKQKGPRNTPQKYPVVPKLPLKMYGLWSSHS